MGLSIRAVTDGGISDYGKRYYGDNKGVMHRLASGRAMDGAWAEDRPRGLE